MNRAELQDDRDHWEALKRTGFFGAQAAGCILLSKGSGRIMLVRRSALVQEPGTWAAIGGAHHASEPPIAAAERELREETKYGGTVELSPLFVFQRGTFRYSNFLAIVEQEFTPDLGWEADAFNWCFFDDLPQPLHFGIEALFARA